MRQRLLNQLNDLLRESGSEAVERVFYNPLQLREDSELNYHRHALVKAGKVYMVPLDLLGIEIDGVPIAGVYDNSGKLTGFK